MCFSFQSSITVLGLYFTRWRVLANALASAGVSLGITLWPLLSRYLLEELGWRGTFLIFGGVLLHCCVCGAVVRPVPASVTPETGEGLPSPSRRPLRGCPAACGRAIRRHLAFDVLRDNVGYRVYTLGVVWMIMGFPLPHIFLVPYAIRHGVDEHKAALLISVIGFSNIFLRPMAGLVAGRREFAGHRKYLFSLAALLNGLTNLVCVASADFRVLVGYCLVYSVSMSGIGALLFQVLMDIVPMDRFSSALGLFTVLESISILISPPLAGEAPWEGRAGRGWPGRGACVPGRFSPVRLFVTAWTEARQAPLSMGFSQQEYWSGLLCPSLGDLPNPGIKPWSLALWADSLLSEPPGKPLFVIFSITLGDWPQPVPQLAIMV